MPLPYIGPTPASTTDVITKSYSDSEVINNQTASYTLALTDAGKLVEVNNASANNLTVPPNSSVAFPVGTRVDVVQQGAGQTTIVAGSGVTLRYTPTLKARAQYSGISLIKRATDEWYVFGDLAAT